MSSEPQLSGRRIQVIGVTGAGKSTFARRLGQELSIPVCELDSLFHKSRAGGALSEDDARRSVQVLVESNDEWILDGKYVCCGSALGIHAQLKAQSLGSVEGRILQQSDRYHL
ncbi:hypothetical protein NHJ13734_009661 [Beauveria thailandica]